MSVLEHKADHQGSKNPFREFRWIEPSIIEKALPNNTYLLRTLGNNKAQVFHRRRLRHYTPLQPEPYVQMTPREWKPDTEVVIQHDVLYARAWECEYGKPTIDSDCKDAVTPKLPEITVRSQLAADETSTIP